MNPTSEDASPLARYFPFLIWYQQINRNSLQADLLAGLTGAIVVLPQGVAYALIAGLPPEYGLYTAIITPVIAGLFGSSLHLISGPTAAISIVVLSVVSTVVPPGSQAFIPAVMTLTLMAGLMQLTLGLMRLGSIVNFISHTVVIGFTAGAAILIGTSQLKYALGLSVESGSSFFATWQQLFAQLNAINPYTVLIALTTIATTLLCKRLWPRSPNMFIGMVMGSLACWLVDGASRGVTLVGALPGSLPEIALPDLSPETLSALLPGAAAVAILGLVEAVSIARAIAIRSGQRIDGNQEFIGQGLSNTLGSFCSCYAGSGSFTRSGINYEAGAQTPLAALFAAVILILILLLIPDITAYLPLAAMAGAILVIAWNLIDLHHIQQICRSSRQESAVLLITFIATLTVELEFAIYLGVIVSLILYLRRTARPRVMEVAPIEFDQRTYLRSLERYELAADPAVKILRIDGSLFFGAVDHVQRALQKHSTPQQLGGRQLLVFCPGINFIDLSGAEMLLQETERLERAGVRVSFCVFKNTVLDELKALGYFQQLERGNFYPTVDAALLSLGSPNAHSAKVISADAS